MTASSTSTITRDTTPVITVDGPSGAGKGTLCSMLATELKWHLLDSGAIYRIVALALLQAECDFENKQALADTVAAIAIQFKPAAAGKTTRILLNGDDVTEVIRTEEVGAAASQVASNPYARELLLDLQRSFSQAPGLVADGRDMGTVVFPDATLKIYLTASAQARAERRLKQLQEQGESGSLAALLESIQQRDDRDMNRAVAPLKPADDAIIIDSTEMSIQSVLEKVLSAWADRS